MIAELHASEFFVMLINSLGKFAFEARKDVATIFSVVVKKGDAVAIVSKNTNIMLFVIEGYDDTDIALQCGVMLREMIKQENLCAKLLTQNADLCFRFFEFSQKANFDVASDAFDTLKLMVTRHKLLAAKFLEANYEPFFSKYNQLILSENYVTQRQSIKVLFHLLIISMQLLSELLLERANYNIMIKYIGDAEHLKIMMNLLRAEKKTIQFESFHVFKIFVANPNKTPAVQSILVLNKEKLIAFLQKFKQEKDVQQFNEEKTILLQTLEAL